MFFNGTPFIRFIVKLKHHNETDNIFCSKL